jgi:ATP-dependent exoDNAse (exonuclease V) alpha subunit
MIKRQYKKRKKKLTKLLLIKRKKCGMKNHNQSLIAQIKKLKNKMQGDQKLKQANQYFEKKLFEKDDEICHLKSHHQDLIKQIKKLEDEKELPKKISHKTISTRSMVDKGTMTDLVKKIPNTVQTSEKGTNVDPIKLPETSKLEERSNKQDPEEIQVPYCHPNHKNRYVMSPSP